MELHVINSNSDGNCYILTANNGEKLIIECGVDAKKIIRAIDFDLNSVVGCLVTHEHKDHCKSIEKLLNYGVEVFSAEKTHEKMKTNKHHNAKILSVHSVARIADFRVISFDVSHDAVQPLGFLIYHPEMGVTLFATDTYYLHHVFKGLNNILIECNYAHDILENNNTKSFLSDRILKSHLSLEVCKSTLLANDLSEVNNIVLIHLSNSNADGARFKREIEAVTGKNVSVASAGLVINNFNIKPF